MHPTNDASNKRASNRRSDSIDFTNPSTHPPFHLRPETTLEPEAIASIPKCQKGQMHAVSSDSSSKTLQFGAILERKHPLWSELQWLPTQGLKNNCHG
ncbi:MAG: hypothetical protein ACK5O8_01035 [Pirellula sp.]